jgi:hypothetical protein
MKIFKMQENKAVQNKATQGGCMFKKTLAVLALVVGMGSLGNLWAATTDTIILRVTPLGTKDVTITDTEYNFGTVAMGATTISTRGIVVTHSGSISQGYGLHISATNGVWTASTAAGPNIYNLRALFNSNASGTFAADDNVLTGSSVSATGLGLVYSGDQNASVAAAAVVPGTTRDLWFRLAMPTSTLDGAERTFTVMVSAL